jgi:hypothetical protein
MKYSEFVESNNNFQSSVNLQYDLNKESKINSYIPTQQSVAILKRYLNAVYNDNYNEDNATVLIGPYGRGKSHLLLVLSALISHGISNISEQAITNLIEKISRTDESVSELAKITIDKSKPMLPIVINSNHTDMNQSFIVALREALDRYELNDFFPETYFDSALKMIDKWEHNFENAIKILRNELKKEKKTVDELKELLYKCVPSAYQLFCHVYPLVSNGAEFNPMQNTDVIKMYDKVADALIEQKQFGGIYIIFDEFSKFLESSVAMKNMQNLKLIQDFAELSVRSNKLHICCITHKEILDYSQSDSFRTVDGRFKKIYFVASAEQSYELVANAICHTGKFDDFFNKHNEQFSNSYQLCHLTGLFNELTDEAYYNILIKDCFPLHPISVYSLIRISEIVGQNERTLFTFLSQDEEYSFNSFLTQEREDDFLLLTVDWIFDYFSDLFRVEIFNTKIHSIWAKTKAAIKKCETAEQIKIVKILAICKMINSDSFLASDINLKASSNFSDADYRNVIDFLISNHIITKRRDGVYAFLTPNGVDIKKSIRNLIEQGSVKLNRPQILKEAYSTPFILPRQHNAKMRIMRYFATTFMEASDFWNYDGDFNEVKKNADGLIIYLIADKSEETYHMAEHLYQLNLPENILVCVSEGWKHNDLLLEYQAVCLLETQTADLDDHFKEELQVYKYDLFKSIKETADSLYTSTNPNAAYYNCTECLDGITKPLLLNRELSNICDRVYPNTPVINNEMINKNKLTAQIRKARVKVIDWILEHNDEITVMDGYGPEVSLLRSTIIVKGLDEAETSNDLNLNCALNAIDQLIIESEENSITCNRFFDLLQSSPFGMRKGTIPIYLSYKMRNMQNVIVLSYKNKEIELSGENLSKIEDNPSDYTLYVEKGTREKDMYLESIISLFSLNNKETISNKCSYAVDSMQKWFRGLSKFTRDHTRIYESDAIEDVDKSFIKLKGQLLKYDINPHAFIFHDVPSFFNCSGDFTQVVEHLSDFANDYNNFMTKIRLYLINKVSALFNRSISGSLSSIMRDWYETLPETTKTHVFSADINAFLHLIKENTCYDDEKVISELAKNVTLLAIEDWNDNCVDDFITNLSCYIASVNEFEFEETTKSDSGFISFSFEVNGENYQKNITETEISGIAETALNNIESELEDYGDAISTQERVALLLKLLRKEMDQL